MAAGVLLAPPAFAQGLLPAAQLSSPDAAGGTSARELEAVTVTPSADASAEGLSAPLPGGQVARGARVGLMGTQDALDTPFQASSYTNALIQEQQARSTGDVLLNDPAVRQARGFGNFQELYVVRGFPLYSDDIGYNGLYGMLPRQYVAAEIFERVEVLRGANAFLNGAAPGGSGLGGSINLVPKRAGLTPLTRVTAGIASGGQALLSADLSRRFGPDQATGVRLNAVRRQGGTGVDGESRALSAVGLGLDWQRSVLRLSADLGYQDHRLEAARPSVTPFTGTLPAVPGSTVNYAQPWTHAQERDLWATVRAEWSVSQAVTGWAAAGVREGRERNDLSGITLQDAAGNSVGTRFANERRDRVVTAEVGVRGHFVTGPVSHQVVATAGLYRSTERNAWAMATGVTQNIYAPTASSLPAFAFFGGQLADPLRVGRIDTRSLALADTLGLFDERLQLTLGLRHQTLGQTRYDYTSGAETDRYRKSAVTPVAGLVYRFTNESSFYANLIEGLTPGEVAPQTVGTVAVQNAGAVFAPYHARQQEIGYKWVGSQLGASVALYQAARPSAYVQDGVFGIQGRQRNRGLELNVFGEAAPGVRLLGGLTWLRATMQGAQDATAEGRQAIGVPQVQATLGAEWELPWVEGLAVQGRMLYTGKSAVDGANTVAAPAWRRTDVGVRYLMAMGEQLLTLRARIDNLFDTRAWTSVGGFPGSNYLVQGQPRTVSLSASMDF